MSFYPILYTNSKDQKKFLNSQKISKKLRLDNTESSYDQTFVP